MIILASFVYLIDSKLPIRTMLHATVNPPTLRWSSVLEHYNTAKPVSQLVSLLFYFHRWAKSSTHASYTRQEIQVERVGTLQSSHFQPIKYSGRHVHPTRAESSGRHCIPPAPRIQDDMCNPPAPIFQDDMCNPPAPRIQDDMCNPTAP